MVEPYLASPTEQAWRRFEREYVKLLEIRFAADPTPFRKLAELAMKRDVYLGCNCPTTKNPNPDHCHTVLALRFMKEKFPELKVVLP